MLSILIIAAVMIMVVQIFYFWSIQKQLMFLEWQTVMNIREYMDNSLDVLNGIAGMAMLLGGASVRKYVQRKIKDHGQSTASS